MSYKITCIDCHEKTEASNIIDLIENHTDCILGKDGGYLKCAVCNGRGLIFRESILQEKNSIWKRYIRGVIRIKTESPAYNPYILLTSEEKEGDIDGIQFCYYKDTRNESKSGKLKHGHGPGGPPAFSKKEFLEAMKNLIVCACITTTDIKNLMNTCTPPTQYE